MLAANLPAGTLAARRKRQSRRHSPFCCQSSSSSARPSWAGGDALSAFINVLIASPLYGLMKPLARATLIDTAERNGIPWRAEVVRQADEPELARLEALRASLTNADVVYPGYYNVPFRACESL